MSRKSGLTTILAIVFLASTLGWSESQPLMTRHVRDVVVSGQVQTVGQLPATQSMRLVLVLPLRNQEGLDNFLQELYDPASPSYRQFLTVEEFTARFGPTQKDYDAVIRFAKQNGFTVVGTSRNRLNIDVTGSVASIEAGLPCHHGPVPASHREPHLLRSRPRTTVDLPFQLWHISGLDNYSIPHPALPAHERGGDARTNATTGSGPVRVIPRQRYARSLLWRNSLTGSGQSLGLLEYYGTDLADLTTYFKNVNQTNNVPVTLDSTDGTSTSCLESGGLRRYRANPRHDAGSRHGTRHVEPRHVRRIDRRRHLQCHGDAPVR